MNVFFKCRNSGDHLCIAIPSQRIPKNLSHHRIAERYMHILALCLFVQINDDKLEHEQTLVDGLGFLHLVFVCCSARVVNSF
jgi:hypothetical protein